MKALRRWAAILLPFVIGARAILLVFQLHGEHDERAHRFDPPAWPPVAGEELRFRSDNPHLAAWGTAANHPQLLVPETRKDFLPTEADSGCVLDIAALLRNGGTLTLKEAIVPDSWRADWSGGATVPTAAELSQDLAQTGAPQAGAPQTGAPQTGAAPTPPEVDTKVLQAEDCGTSGRVELTGYQLHVLVAALSGEAFPPVPDPPPIIRPVHIHVDEPPPPGWDPAGKQP